MQEFGGRSYLPSNTVSGSEEEVKHALIMDEVDGMSGTEDRAGVAELIQIIKDTKIPIICICNDRQHPKIRSLANHCFDVRFPKPRVEQIRARLMSIACQEKVKISKEELDQMIEMSGKNTTTNYELFTLLQFIRTILLIELRRFSVSSLLVCRMHITTRNR
ncbi:hypothetical protein Y032_0163g3461 [Ancylostoma ceylanicum]|uniref:Uncharacterized protein n=1 Tax=Ancylostoma ceylanicum TaxID=53326 RepID=A0A016SXB0_9BILA|nr:hypothetical protein Y032_0163g3461 [Ancylostoma ceylanicum]